MMKTSNYIETLNKLLWVSRDQFDTFPITLQSHLRCKGLWGEEWVPAQASRLHRRASGAGGYSALLSPHPSSLIPSKDNDSAIWPVTSDPGCFWCSQRSDL